jgi:hypothetical protein
VHCGLGDGDILMPRNIGDRNLDLVAIMFAHAINDGKISSSYVGQNVRSREGNNGFQIRHRKI